MPENSQQGNLTEKPVRTPIMLAQAEKSEGEPRHDGEHKSEGAAAGETHSSEGHEHHAKPGEMADPNLLFSNALLIAIILVAFGLAAKSKAEKLPKGFQNLSEAVAESLNNFVITVIGPDGSKHTPFVGTLFLYIGLMNYIGLVPGLHSPTSNITTTLALGVIVFFYVQAWGIRNNGLLGHFSHFLGPKFGKWPLMAPLMLPIELMSELFRPFTLAIRLFGNIFGEDVILVVLAGLGITMMGNQTLGFIPFQFPIMLLSLITCFVQAMVFSTLTCIYLSLVAPHEHEHDEHHAGAHDHHTHAVGQH